MRGRGMSIGDRAGRIIARALGPGNYPGIFGTLSRTRKSNRAVMVSHDFRAVAPNKPMSIGRVYEMRRRSMNQPNGWICKAGSAILAAAAVLLSEPAFAQAPNPLLPHNLSPWGMFLNADIVVKAGMIGLAFASLVTWTVWLAQNTRNTKSARHG